MSSRAISFPLPLTSEQEKRLEESAERRDESSVRQVLHQAVDEAVPSFLQAHGDPRAKQLDVSELRQLLDSLAEESPKATGLSDDAVSRSGIYRDHP